MELKISIDLEAVVAQALAPEKLQPILDKHIIGAITSAIDDATGYRSTFRTVLRDQLAAAMPHGIEIADVAKFQHVLNEVLRNAVHGQNAAALNTALAEAAASVMPDMPATLKLSQIMEDARHGLHVEEREAFYALFEQKYGFSHLYLDRETRKGSRYGSGTSETEKHTADYRLDFDEDGRCYSMKLSGRKITPGSLPNAVGGFDATLLALYVGRMRIQFDMDPDDVESAASEQYDD
ncbi:hypothetical protein P3W66_11895 [Achromobacter denitrificans]|uniref:hypothetical protein n=1 Tax=Achromobacter denitrificans TaxID=32002 RepID=UPI0023E84816|nr:hypothetical protein [Achromobacter denitrificans]MDF3940736.1 hypothetical protein [Achromobacter denitrificans]